MASSIVEEGLGAIVCSFCKLDPEPPIYGIDFHTTTAVNLTTSAGATATAVTAAVKGCVRGLGKLHGRASSRGVRVVHRLEGISCGKSL